MIEVIVALSLLSILILSMLPVLTSTTLQLTRLEESRLQNQFLRNLITCINQDASMQVGGETITPTAGIKEGGSNYFSYRGVQYTVTGIQSDIGLFWYLIEREGMDEPIRLLQSE